MSEVSHLFGGLQTTLSKWCKSSREQLLPLCRRTIFAHDLQLSAPSPPVLLHSRRSFCMQVESFQPGGGVLGGTCIGTTLLLKKSAEALMRGHAVSFSQVLSRDMRHSSRNAIATSPEI
eukprot:COSAG02_NODE_5030_length_4715_cov_3.115035_2_plen_119_part_00